MTKITTRKEGGPNTFYYYILDKIEQWFYEFANLNLNILLVFSFHIHLKDEKKKQFKVVREKKGKLNEINTHHSGIL